MLTLKGIPTQKIRKFYSAYACGLLYKCSKPTDISFIINKMLIRLAMLFFATRKKFDTIRRESNLANKWQISIFFVKKKIIIIINPHSHAFIVTYPRLYWRVENLKYLYRSLIDGGFLTWLESKDHSTLSFFFPWILLRLKKPPQSGLV